MSRRGGPDRDLIEIALDAETLNPASTGNSIGGRLDALPLTPLHGAIMAICAFGLLFDVVEAGLTNALSAVFSAPPHHVEPYQLSWLLASVFAGGAVGAPLLGFLADRAGRRLLLGASLMLLAVTSVLAAVSVDIAWVIVFRTLSGFALGAFPPLMAAYLTDLLPPRRRGTLVLICAAIGFLGAPAVIFLTRWLTPLQPFGFEGWRCVLVIGAIGSAIVGALFVALPESPRWLATRGRCAEAEEALGRLQRSARIQPAPSRAAERGERQGPAPHLGPLALFRSEDARPYRRRALLLALIFFLSPWATVGFPVLSGAVLIEKGFRVADSLLYVGVSMFGPAVGVLLGCLLIDRLERRTMLLLGAGLMAALGLAFAASDAPLPLMVLGAAFNFVSALYVSALNIYDAELFPTSMRALVSSTNWAVNRVASALAPFLLLPVLKAHGAVAMFAIVTGALVVTLALLWAFAPRGFTRKAVE
jgi:putative MFS transporter